MSDPVVLFEEFDSVDGFKVACATLNIPSKLNALTTECIELLLVQLTIWSSDKSIACVFIDGAGDKAFCAGGDVLALQSSAVSSLGGPCVDAENFFAREYRLNYLMHQYNKPIIAWGDGIVMGGGLGIFAAASHRIVTENSRFAMPEVIIGLYPDVGGSYFLNRFPNSIGRFLALTGVSFNAADALYTGIANSFIAKEFRGQLLNRLSQQPCSTSEAVSLLLESLSALSSSQMPAGKLEANDALIESLVGDLPVSTVLDNFSNFDVEKELDFQKELEGHKKWLLQARSNIIDASPLSVLLIDRQLKQCKHLPLDECFRRELILSTNVVRYPDFAEGVRAYLIDKDKAPRWQLTSIDVIPEVFLDSFFIDPWPINPLEDL